MSIERFTPLSRQGEGPGERARIGTSLASLCRQLFGMPDYARYLEHQAKCHAAGPTMSEKEFMLAELERKYAGGGGRCC